MKLYFLILGSNHGLPGRNIEEALRKLKRFGEVVSRSSFYVTEPVGKKHQEGFLNLGVKYKSTLLPKEIMEALKGIEREMGRVFTGNKGHRRIDIDVASGDIPSEDPFITIPHPALNGRKFMLEPICEIDPDYRGGKRGETFRELLEKCGDTCEVIRL